MKVKASLDLASLKNWLLEHGEKLALGVVAVVVLLFTYFAIQREVLDASKQPDNLRELARTVNEHVTASRWDAQREGLQLVDYTERAKSKPVKLGSFALPTLFDPPPHDPKAKRDDPEVLGVEDLRVGSGYDVFAMKADAAARGEGQETQLQAQPWAVVTGLVPIERQKQAYARAFSQAVDADLNRDVPRYARPFVERTEVDEAHPEKVAWTRVPFVDKYEEKWAVENAEEIVSGEYVDDELTGHLGSLANKQQKWGESVSHPKVPRKGEKLKKSNEPVEPEFQIAVQSLDQLIEQMLFLAGPRIDFVGVAPDGLDFAAMVPDSVDGIESMLPIIQYLNAH